MNFKKHVCICGKRYIRKANLERHEIICPQAHNKILNHNIKVFNCKCGKKLTSKYNFERHFRACSRVNTKNKLSEISETIVPNETTTVEKRESIIPNTTIIEKEINDLSSNLEESIITDNKSSKYLKFLETQDEVDIRELDLNLMPAITYVFDDDNHSDKKINYGYMCKCGDFFETELLLEDHQYVCRIHNDFKEYQYICLCNSSFNRNSALIAHQKNCDIFQKATDKNNASINNYKLQLPKYDYKCKCGKIFHTKKDYLDLPEHKNKCSTGIYQCCYCGLFFKYLINFEDYKSSCKKI